MRTVTPTRKRRKKRKKKVVMKIAMKRRTVNWKRRFESEWPSQMTRNWAQKKSVQTNSHEQKGWTGLGGHVRRLIQTMESRQLAARALA
jgi:hypothetical protein